MKRRRKGQKLVAHGAAGLSDEELLCGISGEARLFQTRSREGYASLPVGEHRENWPVRSREFRLWLTQRFFEERGRAPSTALLSETLHQVDARAQFSAPTRDVHLRVAGDGRKISLDLADRRWRTLEVTAQGWRIEEESRHRFRRAPGMLPLPEPRRGGSIESLRALLSLGTPERPLDDWYLLVAWLTAALRPHGPYPILILRGEQGTGKSTLARMLRRLVDPSVVALRRPPRDERDLMISAENSWLLSLDNLSRLSPRLCDSLCTLATGGGFSTRKLFSDRDEALFQAARPVILNGIEVPTERGDLLDRSLIITLPVVAEKRRLAESSLWRRFERLEAELLSALLDTLSGALGELPRVRLCELPRMADFTRWGVACERALRWPKGAFLGAYERKLRLTNEEVLEAVGVGAAIVDFLRSQPHSQWVGTAADFLEALGRGGCRGGAGADRFWPRTPQDMGRVLRRLGVNLRRGGFEVRFWREGKEGRRMISICKLGAVDDRTKAPTKRR